MTEVEKKGLNVSKIAIIVLLALILLLTAAILFFVVSNGDVANIMQGFKSSESEFTMPLDEFIVNLKPEGSTKHYLKISLALMYTDEDHGALVESSLNKIRDSIITTIRTKTYKDLVEDSNAIMFKNDVKESINKALNEEVVKDIYITDIIIQ